MKKSYIADNIMREYNKEKRMKANKQRAELELFIRKVCKDCKNKNTDLCHIARNIQTRWHCKWKS